MQPWARNISNLNLISLYVLACFPVLGMKITVIAIIAFTFFSILSGISDRDKILTGKRKREFLILLIPFILIFIRTWIFDRSENSLFYFEVSLSLLTFPTAFLLFNPSDETRTRSISCWLFTLTSILVVMFGLMNAGIHISEQFGPGKTWESYSQMFRDAAFPYQVRTVFEDTVSIHPTYASIFMGISALIIINSLFLNFGKSNRGIFTLQIIGLTISILMLAVLASRTPFLATMIAATLLCFLHFKKKIYGLYILGAVIFISIILAFLVPSFSERFREISLSNVSVPTQTNENSFNLRTGIFKCSINTIKQNPWLGVGPGNVQEKLNLCYDNISREVYHDKNYNTHNQFLDYWAGLGIAGPLALIILLAYSFISNFRQKNFLAVAITLLFFISMFTENILTRQNGVVVFCFFTGMFFFSSVRNQKNMPGTTTGP